MAGGKFIAMNKVRPGAYINFIGTANTGISIGSRGIATIMLPLTWGPEQSLIEITASDLLNDEVLSKIGESETKENELLIQLALQNCTTLKIFNSAKGGTKASVTLGEEGVKVTAKYPGTFGNKIALIVKESEDTFEVITYADGYEVDNQRVTSASELKANDYVEFDTTGTLKQIDTTLLEGGTDGKSTDSLGAYFKVLRSAKWNTLIYNYDTDTEKVVAFIKDVRENEGKYVQAVVNNYEGADYEGIINTINGVILNDGTEISPLQFTAWVGGATAGADIIDSLTGKVVDNASSIIGQLSNEEIIKALGEGKFVLSLNQDGSVKVEKDINSLHTFTPEKNYTFSKNRVIRELDEIGSSIENIWEQTYLGKVSNNDNGRTLFKSSIIAYLTDLQNLGAIQDFDSEKVTVLQGNDIDSVIANIAIKPVDSMEFLYMTVNVEQ